MPFRPETGLTNLFYTPVSVKILQAHRNINEQDRKFRGNDQPKLLVASNACSALLSVTCSMKFTSNLRLYLACVHSYAFTTRKDPNHHQSKACIKYVAQASLGLLY